MDILRALFFSSNPSRLLNTAARSLNAGPAFETGKIGVLVLDAAGRAGDGISRAFGMFGKLTFKI